MQITRHKNLKELGFQKRGAPFPAGHRRRILSAIDRVVLPTIEANLTRDGFEKALYTQLKRLGYRMNCKIFKKVESQIRRGKNFQYSVDFYHPRHRIAIEVEKTKTTTILLDIVKFIIGHKREYRGVPLIDYGVLIFPDKYRTRKHPQGQGDAPFNRAVNELSFINTILFVKDILLIEYEASRFPG